VARYRDDKSHEMMTANSPNTENLKVNMNPNYFNEKRTVIV
jgi:hypothetical protein